MLQVPAAQQAATPIQLMATAGLRIMAASVASAILSSCAHTLAESTFRFEPSWAFALPGSLEGVYGFLAANYASGALQSAVLYRPRLRKHALAVQYNLPFMGILELGGASAQVTMAPFAPSVCHKLASVATMFCPAVLVSSSPPAHQHSTGMHL